MKHWPPVNMEKRKARSPDRGSLLLQEPLSMNEPVSYTHLTLPTSDLV